MSQYKYKAVKNAKTTNGEIEGKSKKEVATILVNEGYEVISITQKNILNSPEEILDLNIGGIPSKDKTIFLRQLAYMITAGLPINQALNTLASQVKNKQFKKVLALVSKDVQQGMSLSQSLEKQGTVFDKVIINLVRAGEESGNLDKILDRLAFDYEKKQEFSGKVKGALIYPIILIVVIIGVIAMLMIIMVPSIKGLYKDFGSGGKAKELPFITNILIFASDFLVKYWWGIIIIIVGCAIAFRYYSNTPGGKITLAHIYLKVPLFGKIIQLSSIAEFARSLSMLMASGVPIVKSMALVGDSSKNEVYANEISMSAKKIEKGVVFSQSFDKNNTAFTPMVFEMLAIGEQTGKTDTTLAKLADYYEKEVDQITANLNKIMEPVILVAMAGIVLFIALAVYLPIYTLGN